MEKNISASFELPETFLLLNQKLTGTKIADAH